jgi:hypothetical protein
LELNDDSLASATIRNMTFDKKDFIKAFGISPSTYSGWHTLFKQEKDGYTYGIHRAMDWVEDSSKLMDGNELRRLSVPKWKAAVDKMKKEQEDSARAEARREKQKRKERHVERQREKLKRDEEELERERKKQRRRRSRARSSDDSEMEPGPSKLKKRSKRVMSSGSDEEEQDGKKKGRKGSHKSDMDSDNLDVQSL